MSAERDMLLAFRTMSGEWAEQARKEAKAVIAAFNERSDNVAAAAHRFCLTVGKVRENCAKTLDCIQAAVDEVAMDTLDAGPDDLLQVRDVAEEIVALDKEMGDLLRATSAIIQTTLRDLDE
jgi:hypothetical protein